MASSLLRLRHSVVPLRPAAVSAFLLHSRRQHSVPPVPVPFDLNYLRGQMQMIAAVPSISFTMLKKGGELTVHIPGLVKTLTDDVPCVSLPMPRVRKGIPAIRYNVKIADNTLLIHLSTDEQVYLAGMKLPENYDKTGSYTAEFTGEMFDVTLPVLKNTNIMADFVHNTVNRPTPYCVMFDRADLGQKLCGFIADPREKSKSFTLYKKDTCDGIYMKRNLPGVENMVVTREGLCVSLSMPGFEIKDVESAFEYDALIVEGRRKNEHYIAGVRVPEGFRRENEMIKREMQDGLYKATLPHVDVKRRAFSVYH